MFRKSYITTLIISAFAVSCGAQGFYGRVSLGYAGPQATQTLDATGFPYNGSATVPAGGGSVSYNLKKASFGSGVYLDLAAGYMFNEHVGVDAAFNIGISPQEYTATYLDYSSGADITQKQKASSPIFFIPSLVLQTGGDRVNLYSRLGVALPVNTRITQDVIYTGLPGSGVLTVEDDTWQIKNSFSLGFAAAVGVQYHLNERTRITGEVNFLSLSPFIKQSDLKKVVYNGQEIPLDSVGGVQHITYATNATNVTSTGDKQPTYSQPFSNIGLKVGFVFLVGRQGTHNEGKKKSQRGRGDGYYHH